MPKKHPERQDHDAGVPKARSSADPRPRIVRRDLSHLVVYVGDVMTPLDVEWDAMKDGPPL